MEKIRYLVVSHPRIGSHICGDVYDRRGRFGRKEKGKEYGGCFDEPEQIDIASLANDCSGPDVCGFLGFPKKSGSGIVNEGVEVTLSLFDRVFSGNDRFAIGNIKMDEYSSDSIALQIFAGLRHLWKAFGKYDRTLHRFKTSFLVSSRKIDSVSLGSKETDDFKTDASVGTSDKDDFGH